MASKHPGGAKTTFSFASKAPEVCQDKTHPIFLMAYSARRLGNLNQAIGLYERIKLYGSASATALANLAATRMELGLLESGSVDIKLVFEELSESLRLDPDNLYAINNLANAYRLTNQDEKAIEILRYGLSKYPNNPFLKLNLEEIR